MNIGWDMTHMPPIKDGSFEFMSRWLEAVALHPGGHRHVAYANEGFRQMATHPALEKLEWKIAGRWTRQYRLHRELYFARHQREILQDVDVLLSAYQNPLVWKGMGITIALDCVQDHLSIVHGLKNHVKFAAQKRAERRSGRWLAISEWTRRDLARFRGYPLERIRSAGIPVADSSVFRPGGKEAALPHGVAGRRYAFYCSALSPRKNHLRLMEAWRKAFAAKEVLLVLAGSFLPGDQSVLRDAIAAGERDGFVRHLGPVSDAEREALYAGADFAVYPSLHEGFGMPVLEALRHGKPVLTSSGTSTEEVGGDAVLLVNPRDVEEMTSKLKQLAADPALRGRLAEAAPAVLEKYSQERVAKELNEGIAYLCSLPPGWRRNPL